MTIVAKDGFAYRVMDADKTSSVWDLTENS
jgi:hypothetical protein